MTIIFTVNVDEHECARVRVRVLVIGVVSV